MAPGSYTFAVRNIATGCEVSIPHNVTDPNTFGVTVNPLSEVVCFGDNGSISLELTDLSYTGTFSWEIYDTNGTPADRLDDGPAVSTGNMAGVGTSAAIALPAGNYIVEVTQDGFPDCAQTRSFTINTPSAPISLAPVTLSNVGCSNDQAVRPYDHKAVWLLTPLP